MKNADKPIAYALVEAETPIPYRLGTVAPDHGMGLVPCECGVMQAVPKGSPIPERCTHERIARVA